MHHHIKARHEIICALWVQPFKNACSLNSPRMKGKTKKEKQLFFTEVKILQILFINKTIILFMNKCLFKWTDVQNPSRLHSHFPFMSK